MKQPTNSMDKRQSLRVRAEGLLNGISRTEETSQPAEVLMHELLVHKVELEMQIEELQRARSAGEAAVDNINFKREISGTVDQAIERATKALSAEGFGVLTRIDMHSKVKEKTGKDIVPTVILGACNPNLAYEAYTANSDVASLLPCNAVIREIEAGKISLEFVAPSAMLRVLGDQKLAELAADADIRIRRALANA
jgi:uncharacterized protein (DUF302 family)